jgi:Spy/CpxP family protein refolding chaperone
MKIVKSVAVFTILALTTAGVTIADDTKGKTKGTLPQGWSKLGLSEDQKNKIYDIHNKHHTKIEELKKQIKDEEEKMTKEQAAVLTPEQKNKLKEALDTKLGDGEKKKDK